jgi:hypothetical protein
MMVPWKVSRSTIAAQRRGSVKVFVQPEKLSFEPIAMDAFSCSSRRSASRCFPLRIMLAPDPVLIHTAVLITQALARTLALAGSDRLALSHSISSPAQRETRSFSPPMTVPLFLDPGIAMTTCGKRR